MPTIFDNSDDGLAKEGEDHRHQSLKTTDDKLSDFSSIECGPENDGAKDDAITMSLAGSVSLGNIVNILSNRG